MRLLIPVLVSLIVISCTEKHKGKPVARVGKEYLYEDQLKSLMPENLHGDDSIAVRENFVRNWVREQLLYQEGMSKLSPEEKDKDLELEEYYRSLIRFELEKKLISKVRDTMISDSAIEAYYKGNLKNFELKRNIIRLFYVKVPIDAPRLDDLMYWMRYPSAIPLDTIKVYAERYADSYTLDTSKWYYFDEISRDVPIIEVYNPEHFVRSNKFVYLKDSAYHYVLNIVDKRIKDDVAPLSLEKERIREILNNQRQRDLLMSIEKKIYNEALTNNKAEIYQ